MSQANNSTPIDNYDALPNAAFLSANHVYQHRPSSIRSISTSSIASNSAVAAALRAGSHTPEYGVRDTLSDMTETRPGLTLPEAQRLQSRSPSHTAALLAVARAGQLPKADATTPSQSSAKNRTQSKPSITPKPRRLSDYRRSQKSSNINTPNDVAPIAPTPSLVSLFERKSSNTASDREHSDPIIINPVKGLAIQSPKPHRPDGISSVFKMEVGPAGRVPSGVQQGAGIGKTEVGLLAPLEQGNIASQQQQRGSSQDGRHHTDAMYKRDESLPARASARRGEEGGQIHALRNTTESKDFAQGHQDLSFGTSAQTRKAISSPRLPRTLSPLPPSTSNPVLSTLQPIPRTRTAPIDIQPRPRPVSNYDGNSTQSVSAAYRQLYPRKTTPLTTDDELANAIVASSLASSRLSTFHIRDPPSVPASRRQSRHIFRSRTPSPAKPGLRQTLRKQESTDSSEEDASHPFGKHQKKRLIRKHPNKHHEGDRKRWRDAVTEAERKRYEGVWAANKGLFVGPAPDDSNARRDLESLNDQVSNVVVKDIWTRSRLPEVDLEAVWDLVDNDSIGRLTKEEFVVGMWLIDQRLKGRKLPVRVQPTVWASVRGIKGIKIRKQ